MVVRARILLAALLATAGVHAGLALALPSGAHAWQAAFLAAALAGAIVAAWLAVAPIRAAVRAAIALLTGMVATYAACHAGLAPHPPHAHGLTADVVAGATLAAEVVALHVALRLEGAPARVRRTALLVARPPLPLAVVVTAYGILFALASHVDMQHMSMGGS
jgi:hypothetical protein